MANDHKQLAETVRAIRPMVPAKDFGLSMRFYIDLGFCPTHLTPGLVEMKLGAYSFLLQEYYVPQWADNSAMHMTVSDISLWWDHIRELDLESRYGARIREPKEETWGLVAIVTDPSGVIWQIAQKPVQAR